jgi:hypothetical protein
MTAMFTVHSSQFTVGHAIHSLGEEWMLRAAARVGRDRRARRGFRSVFEQKITKSCWFFCYQAQKRGLFGNLVRANTRRFVSFVTFCKNGFYAKIAKQVKAHPILTCFEQKIAKSGWYFCYQRQKRSLLGNWMKADLSRFVSFATFCENGLENRGAPDGHALPRKTGFKLP